MIESNKAMVIAVEEFKASKRLCKEEQLKVLDSMIPLLVSEQYELRYQSLNKEL